MELRGALLDFIADFADWDNSTVREYLETSRGLTRSAHLALGGTSDRPLVVDSFAGGGSIPLEALRIGADTFACDLNPIPVILNKVILEYIPLYGQHLADGVRKWGEWMIKEAEKDLSTLYPRDPDGARPIAYLWARTIQCEGPGCGARIPLFHSSCLAQRGKNSVHLIAKAHHRKKEIDFELSFGDSVGRESSGVLRRSAATCPVCGYTTPAANVRSQFKGRQSGAADARLLAVVTSKEKSSGKRYRLPTPQDAKATKLAAAELAAIQRNAPEDIPDEPLPYLRSIFNIHLLDASKWSYLYTPRQLVSLIRLVRIVKKLAKEIQKTDTERTLANAIVTCLSLAVDRVAAQFSSLSRWQPKGEFVVGTFDRQALGIVWDFAEIRPVGGASGDLNGAIEWVTRVLDANSIAYESEATVEIATATNNPLPDDSASAFITDPPYYDAVPYADLSDYFYVLLKRMLKNVHPTTFTENLSPKKGEIVQLAERNPIYSYKTKEYFEEGMCKALTEARRITTQEGISVIVFAHKTTQGWEVMLSSIIKAGWTVTASWPIDTERAVRPRATDSAALASSVHLVCRPRKTSESTDQIGDWRDILAELPRRVHEWMPRLSEEGVVGADAIFACLGPALEIFSRYSRVEKTSGELVSLKEFLEQVWAAVAKEALTMIFTGADTTGFEEDARITAMWLWTLKTGNGNGGGIEDDDDTDVADEGVVITKKAPTRGFVLEYDAARKIAQGLGVHLEKLSSVVEIKGEIARLLPASERTGYLFGKENSEPRTTKPKKKVPQMKLDFMKGVEGVESEEDWGIKSAPRAGSTVLDRLHQTMILFAAGRSEALKRFLVEEGAGNDRRFWRLAQALSALYPTGTDEKRWVDGVLARKKGLGL